MKRFEEIYATKTADEWCKLLTEADIVNDKLAHYKDMEHSQQAWENEYIHEVTCPNGGKSILVRPAMRSDRMGIPTWEAWTYVRRTYRRSFKRNRLYR